jgi:multiple sugar transport system permease protein
MIDSVVLAEAAKRKKTHTAGYVIGKIATYLGLILFSLWILVPFFIVVITSFKLTEEAQVAGNAFGLPSGIHWDGYVEVFTYTSGGGDIPVVPLGFINTLWMVIPTTLLGLFCSSIAAYAFAKLNFRAKNFMFTALLMTMMIPGTIMLTPSYLLYDLIGWTRTPLPIIIPGMFGAAACVFFMRQFYTGIPTDLIEAAKLDGMGYFGIFFKIMVPLSVPALLAQGILGFIGGYNDYFGPYLYLTDPEMYTLQIALKSFQGTYATNWPTVMAGAVVALIPTLVIYIVAQKYFIQGIATAGMKL